MSFESQRPRRFRGGVILLIFIAMLLGGLGFDALGIAWPITFLVFSVYLLIQSALMIWLVGLLFQQHEMKRYRFDIGGLLIITTMIALPLGAASALIRQAAPPTSAVAELPMEGAELTRRNELTLINSVFAAALYFSLVPLLMVTEAALGWFVATRKRRLKMNQHDNPPTTTTDRQREPDR